MRNIPEFLTAVSLVVSTGQEMVQENQGRGIVSEFYFESGKAKILKKARNEK